MDQILVYSDSLTLGIIPNTRQRLLFHKRWPGVMEYTLFDMGSKVRVIENCLNGRRPVWNDPFKDDRNGSEGLSQVVEMCSPLKLVILMLGTNDFQCMHDNNAWMSAQGMVKLINIIRNSFIEPGVMSPEIMVVAPPKIIKPKGSIAHKFNGAEKRDIGLSSALKTIADENSFLFYDSASVTEASAVDGIHLDEGQHLVLGVAIAEAVSNNITF